MFCLLFPNKTLTILIKGIFFACLLLTYPFTNSAQETAPVLVGPWEYVSGFTVNQTEDYMVLSINALGKNQLFETSLKEGHWSEITPIETINKHHGEGFDIEGPALNYNSQLLFFHANFPNSEGGFDIYYSQRGPNGWGEPINIGAPINTPANEMYPSVPPANDRLVFARSTPNIDFKKPKDTPECQKLYMAYKSSKNTWNSPVELHDLINRGCEYSPSIANDGRTIVFASVDVINHKDGYNVYFTREIMEDNWLDAVLVNQIASEETNLSPKIVGNHIYFLKRTSQRRREFSQIYKAKIPSTVLPEKTHTSKGRIVNLDNNQPINAELVVFDPTTLKELGYYSSVKETGNYELPLLDQKNYIVDIRKHGYSFASFMVDLRKDEKILGPDLIQLFSNIELAISVFDSETFRPIEANVIVSEADNDSKIYTGKIAEEGIYIISLPLGKEYIVKAISNGFEDNQFALSLEGDVIFSKFERNLPLKPIRKVFEIIISDSETQEDVAAEVLITNLSREEVIIFSASDIKDGKISAMLREGDKYEFTVRGAQGYSFYNQTVDLQEANTRSLKAELVSLKTETSIRLNNINFGSNSAELSSESFPELNRVVQLIIDNPNIILEISAHTDNVGSASFNLLLSERRAQSVVNYLLDNGVDKDKLIAKGYGLANPMVPNISDENRALNRRVEFKIIDIMEDEQQAI